MDSHQQQLVPARDPSTELALSDALPSGRTTAAGRSNARAARFLFAGARASGRVRRRHFLRRLRSPSLRVRYDSLAAVQTYSTRYIVLIGILCVCVCVVFPSCFFRLSDLLRNVQQPERCDSSYRKALAEFAPPNRNATVYVAVGEENRAVRRQLGLLSSAYNVVRKRDLVPAALLPSVREALAIVDKLICLRARAFIGFVCSTYSVWIAKQFEWSKRPAKLVHCCEIVS